MLRQPLSYTAVTPHSPLLRVNAESRYEALKIQRLIRHYTDAEVFAKGIKKPVCANLKIDTIWAVKDTLSSNNYHTMWEIFKIAEAIFSSYSNTARPKNTKNTGTLAIPWAT